MFTTGLTKFPRDLGRTLLVIHKAFTFYDKMMIKSTNFCRSLLPSRHLLLLHFPSLSTLSSSQSLEQAIKSAVEAKSYNQIPDLLVSWKQSSKSPNPFSFLSSFPESRKTHVVDELLQSLILLRPRNYPQIAFACLLSYTLQSPNPLPLSLAIIQCFLRSGSLPVPQMKLFLASAWLESRSQSLSVSNILMEMNSIGYLPDCGICNYVISSLCSVGQLQEAVRVLKGMGAAGCVPDLESYGAVIATMCMARKTANAVEMMKEMAAEMGLTPRQGTIMKVVAALRANREIWKVVEVIEFLEKEGFSVGFECYELVVEGCLECKEYILAAKVVMGMTDKGFIPYIKVRQKVFERLVSVGEWRLACTVRQRFTELSS